MENILPHYDYIILGAGASGLSLADRFTTKELSHFNVLIIDKDEKKVNDRTWCSWVKGSNRYDDIAKKTWSTMNVFSKDGHKKVLDKEPYRYRMILAGDFYKAVKNRITAASNIKFLHEEFISLDEQSDKVIIKTNTRVYSANHVFKSFIDVKIDKDKCLYVDQHFKGWFLETETDFFDEEACNMMDFRVDQKNEVRFMYVLPFNKRKALVELAIFSNDILAQEEYDDIIKNYIDTKLKIIPYNIVETEFGIIPMTSFDFSKFDTKRITCIGTMAGVVKPSSGYAFVRIQEHTDEIVKCMLNGENPKKGQTIFKKKYKLFDATLLDVFLNQKKSGADIFYNLFVNTKTEVVFKFLDEKTNLFEELRFMNSMDRVVFAKSFFRQLFKIK